MYAVSEAEVGGIRTQLNTEPPLLAHTYNLSVSLQALRLALLLLLAGHASRDTGRARAELWYS